MSGIEVKDSPLPASPLYSLPLIFKCDLSAGKRAHARPQERERDGSEFSTSADDAPQLIFFNRSPVQARVCSGSHMLGEFNFRASFAVAALDSLCSSEAWWWCC